MLNTAIEAAKLGARILMENFHSRSAKDFTRKADSDYVTDIDKLSQNAIVEYILNAFPHHAILAEEEGGGIEGEEFRWIIDPLDGTTNYIHGFPVFAVSVAVERYQSKDNFGIIEAGAVINPLTNDLYYAEKGKGAFQNGDEIKVSGCSEFQNALIATGFPFREKSHLEQFFAIFRNMFQGCSGIRRAGAAALDLCWVASGALDGFWEKGLSVWDLAAGCLIVLEAGGVISDFQGGNEYLKSGNIITANSNIYPYMLNIIKTQH